jgi:peptidyl-prolyl cis-trans isomerase D
MLQKIREKITGWVAGIILAVLAFVFAVWGIDIGFSNQSVAAVVNGDKIPIAPVRQAIQNQMSQFQQAYGAEVPELVERQVRDSVIEGFVRNRLLVQRIRDEGYRVSDEAVAESVRQIPVFQVGGQFSLDAYRAMLANVGYSPTAFEAEQRQNMEIQQLQDGILGSAFITPLELDQRIRIEREQRELSWVTASAEKFRGQVEITDEQIQEDYAANPDRHMSEEAVDVVYLEVSLADIADAIEVTERDLRAFYESEVQRDPDMYRTPEQRRARHILVSVEDDGDREAALAEANALAARVRGGEDFAEVARAESDDSGSANLGGDLDWVEPGMMVGPFDEALFAMEEGQISDPVRTPFGYHVILLEGIRPGDVREYDEARADLLQEYQTRTAEDQFYERAERMAELAFENPGSLEPAADELGLEIQRLEKLTRSGGEGVGASAEVIAAAFSEEVLSGGENSGPLEIEEGRAIVLRVDQHFEPEVRPLEEVSYTIRARLEQDAIREKTAALGAEALARIESGEAANAVAEDMGLDYSGVLKVGRTATEVPLRVREAAFGARLADGGTTSAGTQLADGSYAVWTLSAVEAGDLDSVPEAERAQLREQLAGASGGSDLNAYVNQLRSESTVVVNEEQFE